MEVIPLYCKVDDNVIPHSLPPSYERIDKEYRSKFLFWQDGKEYGKTVYQSDLRFASK